LILKVVKIVFLRFDHRIVMRDFRLFIFE
jgi:hypothetical protein